MKNKGTFKKILRRVGKYKFLMALSILFAAVTVLLTLYIPILIGDAIDLAVGRGNVDMVGIGALLLQAGTAAVVCGVLTWLMNAINNKITYFVTKDIRDEAFRHLQVLPLSYLDSHPSGKIISNIISDVDQFADGLLMGFTQLFTGIVTILATLVLMLTINWKVALVVIVFTPLSLLIASFISKSTYSMFLRQSECRGEQTTFIDEYVGNQKTVRAFSHEDEAQTKFDEINDRLGRVSLKAIFFSSLTNPGTRFVNNLIYAGVALAGSLLVLQSGEGFTVGILSCFLSYANQYTKPFNEISGVITEFQNSIACAARVFDLMEAEPQIPDAPDALTLDDVKGNVELRNVRFSYVPEQKLIENLNLCVKPGQRVAIVGPTGCGKTTLINLLMRFYDVCDGSIELEGEDIRSVTRRSLRSHYGMVLQETWLRSGTVRDNIRIGKSDATDEEVIAAAKQAHAHSFIRRLPNGYDTVIGEDGGSLSQGQKQLLCIARLMLALPPMLILDEATSSIDTRTELKVQDAFAKLMQGRTSFVVAHRLSTIRTADLILVMRDGNVIEQGTHEELLSLGGFYHELYYSQFETTE